MSEDHNHATWPKAPRSFLVLAIAYSTGQFYLSAEIGWGAIASGAMGGAAAGAAGSALYGGNLAETLNSAARGAVSGALFGWAGGQGANPNDFARYAAHAGAGCVSAVANGNDCGGGAASAVFGKWATNQTGSWGPGAAQFTAAVVAGGVGSVIAGGKFENGATTAAYGYLFNQLASHATRAAAANAAAAGNGALDPETANRRYARAGAALDRLIDKSIGLDGPEEYQYRLVANDAGNYPSVRGGEVWLERGDTYKIGTSLDPDSRYPKSFLRNLNVSMSVETTGNRYQVLAVEKIELMIHFSTNLNLPPSNAYFK